MAIWIVEKFYQDNTIEVAIFEGNSVNPELENYKSVMEITKAVLQDVNIQLCFNSQDIYNLFMRLVNAELLKELIATGRVFLKAPGIWGRLRPITLQLLDEQLKKAA